MKNRNIIIDTSVILKWFFPDELLESALKIQDDFAENTINIILPSLTYYEVSNVLRSSVMQNGLDAETAKKFYDAFLNLDFVVYTTKTLFAEGLNIAITKTISSYDSAYIALAEYLEIPFYTADEKLLKKVKGKYVKHIDEYLFK